MSNPIKPTLKSEILPVSVLLVQILLGIYFYLHFPEKVPTHWNFKGEIDGWSSGTFAAIFFPALTIGIYLMMLFLPNLDPKKERYADFKKVYHLIKNTLVIFLAAIYLITGLAGLGYNMPINLIMPFGVGLLFLVMGNYLGKIKRNWFMGIRTPWTISSEEVWNKTHRLGGKMFMATGFVMMLGAFINSSVFLVLFITSLTIVLVIPVVYSYILFKKEKESNSQTH